MSDSPMPIASLLARETAEFLGGTLMPRLEAAVALLDPSDLWWRPHQDVISVGNILAHLEGNVRQWILSGLRGDPDHRVRAAEFVGNQGADGPTLLGRLRHTVDDAASWLRTLPEKQWTATYRIQGFEVTGVYAVVHVVEHFSWHTGQTVWIAKARSGAGHGLAFFDDTKLNDPTT